MLQYVLRSFLTEIRRLMCSHYYINRHGILNFLCCGVHGLSDTSVRQKISIFDSTCNANANSNDTWSRLFDHRPFLNGETNFFIKEFQDNRKDREVDNLLNILEKITDIRDTPIENNLLLNTNFLKLHKLLDIAYNTATIILDNDTSCNSDVELKQKRSMRSVEWECFLSEIEAKYLKINKTFEDKETELTTFYSELEKNIQLNN